jgi:bifunctional DNA-binding transcriptional regulator/antitoxin component of YhaV-PrlF toxin-antitoxin module
MVRVVVNNGQYKLTIPKDLANSKRWTRGTKLRFVEDLDGRVFLVELQEELNDEQD